MARHSPFRYPAGPPVFEIVGNQIRVKAGAEFDVESAKSHDLALQVTDSAGNTYSETVTVSVKDAAKSTANAAADIPEDADENDFTAKTIEEAAESNDEPTNISLRGGSVEEGSVEGTVVAILAASDPDAGDTFRYSIDGGSSEFEIVGDEIRVKAGANLDYESVKSHDLTIKVTDAGGLSYSEKVTISVDNLNESPTEITLSGGSVDENARDGTVVARLAASDPDAGDTFTYSIEGGSSEFEFVGNEIRVKAGANLDYESARTHDLTIKVTDAGGLSHSESVTISVDNLNEGPTDITLSGGSVDENAGGGTVVARLAVSDPDAGDAFSYSIEGGSSEFEIVGNEIRVKAGADLDYDSAKSHDLTIRVTDAGGLSYSERVTVGVNDTVEDLVLYGTNGNDLINGDAGNDYIDGGHGDDTINGKGGDDVIRGNRGDDTLDGGAGNDTFKVYGSYDGTDTFIGGAGTDTVEGYSSSDIIRVTSNLANLSSIEVIDGGAGTDTLLGTASDDVLDFSTGIELRNIESIDAGYGNDTVTGTDADDVIRGNRGDDTLDGGAGNDTFKVYGSYDGTDTFIGGAGTDTVEGYSSSDIIRVTSNLANLSSIEVIDGGAGTDTLLGSASDDVLDFSTGIELRNIESIDAGYGNDTVTGTDADDVIRGNRGDDTLDGGAGNDTFKVYGSYDGTDTFIGGAGTDTVEGYSSSDIIRVTSNLANLSSIEVIDGGAGTDTLLGTASDDVLDFSTGIELRNIESIDAGYGNDTVTGTDADDVIRGNRGDDTLDGGAGNDRFWRARPTATDVPSSAWATARTTISDAKRVLLQQPRQGHLRGTASDARPPISASASTWSSTAGPMATPGRRPARPSTDHFTTFWTGSSFATSRHRRRLRPRHHDRISEADDVIDGGTAVTTP